MLFNAEKSDHLSPMITGNAQNANSCRIDMETTKIPISAKDGIRVRGVEWRAYFQACGLATELSADVRVSNCPSLQKRFDYFTLTLFFKVRIHQAANSLYKLLPPPSSSSGYTFRKISYPVPAVNRSSTLKSFLPRAIILWNALPVELQAMKSVHSDHLWDLLVLWDQLKLIWSLKFLSFLFSFFLTLHAHCCAVLPWT